MLQLFESKINIYAHLNRVKDDRQRVRKYYALNYRTFMTGAK